MRWLENRLRKRAARRFARSLPPILHQHWGSSEFYTVGQVERALKLAGLAGPHEAIAFAALLTREDYVAHFRGLAKCLDYDEAKALLSEALAGAPWPSYRHESMSNQEAAGRYGAGGGL